MKHIWIFLLLLGVFWTSCKKDRVELVIERPKVDLGGYSVEAWSAGSGPQTIIFESGLGDGGELWVQTSFFTKLAKNHQLISYSRAGYDQSDEADNDRDLKNMAADLHALIDAIAVNDQVILVGHSLGGAVVRYYANQYPEDVQAILLIDPTHEAYHAPTLEEENQLSQLFKNASMPGAAAEAEQLMEDIQYLVDLEALPDVPTTVLTSIRQAEDLDQADRQKWADAHALLGEGLTDFQHILTQNSGHYIQVEEPDLVLTAINELLNR